MQFTRMDAIYCLWMGMLLAGIFSNLKITRITYGGITGFDGLLINLKKEEK
jgi:hypothetical protein